MTLTLRRVSPKVRSIRLECRMRLRCSAGNSRWTTRASRLSATQPTASAYAGQLEDLAAALVLWRRQEHCIGPGTRSRNLLAATCGCGRRIRAAKTTLAEAPIVCGACGQPFEPEDTDQASN